MNPPNADNLSNIDIVVYALYLLGGWYERVHTEDIALKCFELAPSKFSWIKHPKYPDLSSAYDSLRTAKKRHYGLVNGESERKRDANRIGGWQRDHAGNAGRAREDRGRDHEPDPAS